MRVLGHRGSRLPGPENTVEAVDAALRAGADGVEVDIRRTSDGVLVCVHDPRLRGRAVIRRTAAELAERGVPPLTDVLEATAGRGRLVIEVKNQPGQPDFDAPRERTAHALTALLAERDRDGIVVSSFDWFAVEAVRDAGIGVRTAFLTPPRVTVGAGIAYAHDAGHAELHAHTSAVLGVRRAVDRVHAAGMTLAVWTVKSLDVALRLRDQGVDAVICDDPAAVVAGLR
jgi:glycerophosphoryl diester phosphodiesterase